MTNIKPLRRLLAFFPALLASALLCAPSAQAQEGPQRLPMMVITAGIHNIQAQIAQTPEQRAIGLMNRPSMPTSEGMLFVFEQAATQCFWMKNTLLPLSVAFVDDTGRIVNIDDMKPQTLESHCSTKPVRFVLEMNKGWFDKRGLKAGSSLQGPMFKP